MLHQGKYGNPGQCFFLSEISETGKRMISLVLGERPLFHWRNSQHGPQKSILQNSISPPNIAIEFSSENFGHISTPKQQLFWTLKP
jgi:hypothetical protein